MASLRHQSSLGRLIQSQVPQTPKHPPQLEGNSKLKNRKKKMNTVSDIFVRMTDLCEFVKTGHLIKFMQSLFMRFSILSIVTLAR